MADSDANPYAAPKSNLSLDKSAVETTGEPRSVDAGNGWQWMKEGFGLVFDSFLPWIGAIFVLLIVNIVIGLVPVLGSIATSLLGPVFAAGLILGAHEQSTGGSFTVGHVFAGFQKNVGALVGVGAIYLGGAILIAIAVFIPLIGMGGLGAMMGDDPEKIIEAFTGPAFLIGILVAMGLLVPLMMAYWFAPALVALQDLGAVEAMGKSFKACMKNFVPFLVYGVVTMVLVVVCAIPLGLGFFILIPAMTASIYTAYRDIFAA